MYMDIDNILNDIQKYHYIGCGKKTCKVISSSDDKTEAKNKTVKFLKPHESDIIDSIIYLVAIKKSTKKWNKNDNELLPGPIVLTITEYKVKRDIKLKEISSGINNQVFITQKYLKKNDGINIDDILKSVSAFCKGKLKKGLMEKNIL